MRGQWRVDRRYEMNLKSGFKGPGNTKHFPLLVYHRTVAIITSRSAERDIVSSSMGSPILGNGSKALNGDTLQACCTADRAKV